MIIICLLRLPHLKSRNNKMNLSLLLTAASTSNNDRYLRRSFYNFSARCEKNNRPELAEHNNKFIRFLIELLCGCGAIQLNFALE